MSGRGRQWWTEWGAPAVRALALAVVLLPASWSALSQGDIASGWLWVLRVALVGLHAALLPPLVTRAPVVAFATGSAAMLLLVAGPDLGGPMAGQAGDTFAPVLLPSSLVWFVLLYAVAAGARAPWPGVALVVGGVGAALTTGRLWDAGGYDLPLAGDWGWRLLVGAAAVGGTLAAWALGRYRAARLAWLDAVADRAAAQERRRIAREMHDVVAHSLAVVVAQAEGGRLAVSSKPDRAPEILETIADTGREALDQMRGLLGVLREPGATPAEPAPPSGAPRTDDALAVPSPLAPQPTLAQLPDLVERVRRSGTRVSLETRGTPRQLDLARELTAYRMVQESLTNVVKHGGPGTTARVLLDWTDGLVVDVTDDGAATPDGAAMPGRGLHGMRERVEAVGGRLSSGPAPAGGWRNCARIPA